MRPYEIMVILDPTLDERTVAPSLETFLNVVRKDGGSVDKVDIWGRRRLAYEIAHKTEGTYHLLRFTAEPETLAELSRILKISDGVVRHMATKEVAGSTRQAPPQPDAAVPEPEYAGASVRSEEREG
jgi:small subunit ribosomal protein S6